MVLKERSRDIPAEKSIPMLDILINNKTRVKLLLRLFLNGASSSYLRGLEAEFQNSTNAIRIELNRFEKAGLLLSDVEGNRKVFRANREHPLYRDINALIKKHVGLDSIIENVVKRMGHIVRAFIVGDMALGIDRKVIELVLIGNQVDKDYLVKCIRKAEKLIHRKILFFIVNEEQEKLYLGEKKESLLIWDSKIFIN